MRAVAAFLGRTAGWLVILTASALVIGGVLVPRIAGATPYTITTGSMAPSLPAGTLIVVRPVDPATLSVGDVVTVQLESGEETVVTHRIAAVQHRMDGQLQFVTKGDTNEVPDAEPRLPVQIRGEVWYSIPYAGYLSTALTGVQREGLITLVGLVLAGYAGWMFLAAWRERRAKERPGPPAPQPVPGVPGAPSAPPPPERRKARHAA